MSREIKFRAWDQTKKTMGKPFDFVAKMKTAVGIENCYDKFPRSTIFMQYTGLKDKNGVEIYEGDVVRGKHSSYAYSDVERVGNVVFEQGGFQFTDKNATEFYFPVSELQYGYEVIGNIWENPRLLRIPIDVEDWGRQLGRNQEEIEV